MERIHVDMDRRQLLRRGRGPASEIHHFPARRVPRAKRIRIDAVRRHAKVIAVGTQCDVLAAERRVGTRIYGDDIARRRSRLSVGHAKGQVDGYLCTRRAAARPMVRP